MAYLKSVLFALAIGFAIPGVLHAQGTEPARTNRPFEKLEAQIAGQPLRLASDEVEKMVATWPEELSGLIANLRETYGEPDHVSSHLIMWSTATGLESIRLYASGPQHDLPQTHVDRLEMVVHYKVPPERLAALAEFNGSVHVDRTKGTMSAKCDSIEKDILVLNLAHEVVLGKRTAEEARQELAAIMAASDDDPRLEYRKKLLFGSEGRTAFKDVPVPAK